MMLRQKIEKDPKNLGLNAVESFLESNLISFEEIYQHYTVGIVDMVNSTKIISKLSQEKACLYYGVFLNAIAHIAKSHGAIVVKNIGDGVLFYFPKKETSNIEVTLDCATNMIKASEMINTIFKKREIPQIQYRISLDFGPIMIAKCMYSSQKDIFGPTVNLCAKLNRYATPNGFVIGSDLYQIVKKSKSYRFVEVGQFPSSFKQNYPIYSVQ